MDSTWTFLGMNYDTWLSTARSVLKAVGGAAVAAGVVDASHAASLGATVDALITGVGSVAVAAGWFWSLWHHTPDAVPVVKPVA